MRLYKGSLHGHLDERRSPDGTACVRPLVHTEVAAFAAQILEGLAQLYVEGIVAQDLKPSNLLMDEREQLVIADFGLAAVLSATTAATAQSTTGAGGGTPVYKAPEQHDPDGFGKISPKTDMWAFGCVVIELLTGFPPWRVAADADCVSGLAEEAGSGGAGRGARGSGGDPAVVLLARSGRAADGGAGRGRSATGAFFGGGRARSGGCGVFRAGAGAGATAGATARDGATKGGSW